MVPQQKRTAQTFGVNRTVGYVQGETETYTVQEGKMIRATDPLAALNTQELEALAQQGDAARDACQKWKK